MKIAWSIAASDSSAGAGIQADLASFAHFGVHGCSIISKITAQNSHKISAIFSIPVNIFQEQLDILKYDFPAHAIKISVMANIDQIQILSNFLDDFNTLVVYDPVLISSTNSVLTENNLIQDIVSKLLPKVTLITPNIPEAEILTGIKIRTYQDVINAAKILLNFGVQNVLIKGGHFDSNHASDLFLNKFNHYWLCSNRQNLSLHVHGTGCHLSSAIAANLALGHEINDAIVIAKQYINSAIANSYLPNITSKQLYIPQFSFQAKHEDMPIIIDNYLDIDKISQSNNCLKCGELGLYPIVNSSKLVTELVGYGVKTIQLRVKADATEELENEIVKSIKFTQEHDVKLFINDHWQLAIKHKAYGVHLGQEDITIADINSIKFNKLRLGISTHNYYELARAITHKPSYVALGPIYKTLTKAMIFGAQGLDKIAQWQKMINCPLVVIGGINLDNIDQVLNAGAKNIALISGIANTTNPQLVTQTLLKKINPHG